jgi:hypothetical protein
MTVDELKAMPVAEWALPDCVLLLWVFRPPHLASVLSLWLRGDFFQGDLPGTSSVHSMRACRSAAPLFLCTDRSDCVSSPKALSGKRAGCRLLRRCALWNVQKERTDDRSEEAEQGQPIEATRVAPGQILQRTDVPGTEETAEIAD